AHRSVIMVDPFPAEPLEPFTYGNKTLFDMASKLFGSLKEQARFKPEEFELAADQNIFSRYLIAPSRDDAQTGHELASASVGAFGGFLSEKFRQHDFQLGRKNAQSFLMNYFYIGVANPIVKENIDWLREKGCNLFDKNNQEFIQVIPMVDLPDHKITDKIIPVNFNSIVMTQKEFDSLSSMIETRITTVFQKSYLLNEFIDAKSNNWFFRCIKTLMGIKPIKNYIAHEISSFMTNKINEKIKADLLKRQLLK
ncbi:hypothetical protein, partial [Sulfuricurvum sp.]|uniref:hypothetical protein n=1 Tax=Sulfuricurvum sp. TaxID=2025608 RepID=UPI003BB4F276